MKSLYKLHQIVRSGILANLYAMPGKGALCTCLSSKGNSIVDVSVSDPSVPFQASRR